MNVIKFEIKGLIKSTLIWSLICSALIILFMSLFPSMKDSGMQDIIGTKLDAFPPAVLEAFNIESTMDFSNISQYLAYAMQYIVMAGGVYGAILGVSSLIKEETEGTIEFLYAKPITRSKIVTYKLISSAIIYYVYVFIVGLAASIIAFMVMPEDVKFLDLIMDIKTLFIGVAFLGYIFMAVGFLISTIIKSSKTAVPTAIGLFFVTYFMGIIGKLKEGLSFFKYLSPFEYVVPINLIKEGFNLSYIWTGLGIIIVSLIGAYMIYNRKDMRI
ncbi:ABC transporter permease subunit [Clostridium sp.]|uniref:ABC transporter permease subunit n=1 Tax=Clostridium sp. TaxID=1506 RepID=UPI003464B948